jgi:hypothetical protein
VSENKSVFIWTFCQLLSEKPNCTKKRQFFKGRGVLGSKATGEPATHMGVSAALAVRKALNEAKTEILGKDPKEWFALSKSFLTGSFVIP